MMLIRELGYDVSPTFAGSLELGFGIRNLCKTSSFSLMDK